VSGNAISIGQVLHGRDANTNVQMMICVTAVTQKRPRTDYLRRVPYLSEISMPHSRHEFFESSASGDSPADWQIVRI
jgi:hypothetical protein